MRGNEFERLFAIYRILFAVDEVSCGAPVRFAAQLKNAHVDDWVEDRAKSRAHFQLKRVKSLGWSAVRSDFATQAAPRVGGKALQLSLVVPTKSLVRKLNQARRRVPGVLVMHFPGWTAPDAHIGSDGPGRAALFSACVLTMPTRSDLEAIWKEVAFAWDNARKLGAFVPARRVLARLKDQHLPIKRAWEPTADWRSARKQLSRIRELSVEVRSGMLLYSTSSGIDGMISCTSAGFERFVEAVNRKRPVNVESLLELMP